jgi:hypothetical protein
MTKKTRTPKFPPSSRYLEETNPAVPAKWAIRTKQIETPRNPSRDGMRFTPRWLLVIVAIRQSSDAFAGVTDQACQATFRPARTLPAAE